MSKKNSKYFTFLFFSLFTFVATGLNAFSMGSTGQRSQGWSQAYFSDDGEVQAFFPGEPSSNFVDDMCLLQSEKNETYHVLHTPKQRFFAPTEMEFIASWNQKPLPHSEIRKVKTKMPNVHYIYEGTTRDPSSGEVISKWRIIASAKRMYYMLVEGKDLSQAKPFFNSLEVLK